jgi:hypothetical protein
VLFGDSVLFCARLKNRLRGEKLLIFKRAAGMTEQLNALHFASHELRTENEDIAIQF